MGRGVAPEAHPPAGAQCFDVEAAQARDLGFDGRGLGGLRNDLGFRHGNQGLRPCGFASTHRMRLPADGLYQRSDCGPTGGVAACQ